MSNIKSIAPSEISTQEVYGILSSAVAPRPICFVSTIDKEGNVNLSPYSFFNVFSSNPPILIFAPVRGREGNQKDSFLNVKEVPEVVINIVNYPMVEQMSLASTRYERGVNEFEKAGFTEVQSKKVRPPRVAEAPISLECKVTEIVELAQTPGAGNLIFSEVAYIHINEAFLDAKGALDSTKLDLVGRMGGNWYIRGNEQALFEIPKPLKTRGIGVDALPESIKRSTILTGNNLGRLGNSEQFPTNQEIKAVKELSEVKSIFQEFDTGSTEMEIATHQLAQQWLQKGHNAQAFALLLCKNYINSSTS